MLTRVGLALEGVVGREPGDLLVPWQHAAARRGRAARRSRRRSAAGRGRRARRIFPSAHRGYGVQEWHIVAHHAGAVFEPVIRQELRRPRVDLIPGCPVAARAHPELALEDGERFPQHGLFLAAIQARELLVEVPVRADLEAAVEDRPRHARVLLRDIGRNEECRGDRLVLEQAEDARHADLGSILALRECGQPALERGILGQRSGLTIDVETQHHCTAFATWPGEAWGGLVGGGLHRISRATRKPRLSRRVPAGAKSRQLGRRSRGR